VSRVDSGIKYKISSALNKLMLKILWHFVDTVCPQKASSSSSSSSSSTVVVDSRASGGDGMWCRPVESCSEERQRATNGRRRRAASATQAWISSPTIIIGYWRHHRAPQRLYDGRPVTRRSDIRELIRIRERVAVLLLLLLLLILCVSRIIIIIIIIVLRASWR